MTVYLNSYLERESDRWYEEAPPPPPSCWSIRNVGAWQPWTEPDACWISTVQPSFFRFPPFPLNGDTVKRWFGKSADPWLSSLWQQCPGARDPPGSGLNKEPGWRLQLEHARKQCTNTDPKTFSSTAPPSFSQIVLLTTSFFPPAASQLLPEDEWAALFPLKMLIINFPQCGVMRLYPNKCSLHFALILMSVSRTTTGRFPIFPQHTTEKIALILTPAAKI